MKMILRLDELFLARGDKSVPRRWEDTVNICRPYYSAEGKASISFLIVALGS